MNQQARLPENCEEPTISDLVVGDSVYTVPWAMWVDKQRCCWLHPEYTVHTARMGTVQMPVEKRDSGYYVDIRGLDHSWKPRHQPSYVGGDHLEFIPVAGWIE